MRLEVALFTLDVARNDCESVEAGNNIIIAELSSRAAIEILLVRSKCFRDIVDVCVEQGRQMANLVEGSHVTHPSSYRTTFAALNTRIELEAAKEVSREHLGTGTKKHGARGAFQSDN